METKQPRRSKRQQKDPEINAKVGHCVPLSADNLVDLHYQLDTEGLEAITKASDMEHNYDGKSARSVP